MNIQDERKLIHRDPWGYRDKTIDSLKDTIQEFENQFGISESSFSYGEDKRYERHIVGLLLKLKKVVDKCNTEISDITHKQEIYQF